MKYHATLPLAIGILFFPLYKCDGLFDTFYENMINAQETLKDVASSINSGMKSLTKTIKFLDKFVDSTLEEDCEFTCKNKNEAPYPNPNYIPEVDGCGSLGLFLKMDDLPNPIMNDCCNEHDKCYGRCGSDKEICDKQFKRCLYSTCDVNSDKIRYKMCQGGAKMLYTATLALGCASYKEAQGDSCICRNKHYKAFRTDNEL